MRLSPAAMVAVEEPALLSAAATLHWLAVPVGVSVKVMVCETPRES